MKPSPWGLPPSAAGPVRSQWMLQLRSSAALAVRMPKVDTTAAALVALRSLRLLIIVPSLYCDLLGRVAYAELVGLPVTLRHLVGTCAGASSKAEPDRAAPGSGTSRSRARRPFRAAAREWTRCRTRR